MSAVRNVVTVAACAFAVAACGRHEAKSGASSADSHAPGTTLASLPGACETYLEGTPGVVRTFCDGPAVVKVNVGGADYELKGGTCAATDGKFTLHLGVVTSPELGGPKPDYVGLTTQTAAGTFTNAALAVNVGGKAYTITNNSGAVSATSGTFTGTAQTGAKVVGSFSC